MVFVPFLCLEERVGDACIRESGEEDLSDSCDEGELLTPVSTPSPTHKRQNPFVEVTDTPESSAAHGSPPKRRRISPSSGFRALFDHTIGSEDDDLTQRSASVRYILRPGKPESYAGSNAVSPATTSPVLEMKLAALDKILGQSPQLAVVRAFIGKLRRIESAMPEAWSDEERYWRGLRDPVAVEVEDLSATQNTQQIKKKLYDPAAELPTKYKRYPWSQEIHTLLREKFGKTEFRPNQETAINETLLKRDVFLIMPTGIGKSLCFQLPAFLKDSVPASQQGLTVVVSPMLSLVANQLSGLRKLGLTCFTINHSQNIDERDEKLQRLHNSRGFPAIIYITPELLNASETIWHLFRQLSRKDILTRFVFDEAHCIPEMGKTFRDTYLQVGKLRKEFPTVPIMAMTATARDEVQQDVIKTLNMRNPVIIKSSLNRPNLQYEIVDKTQSPKIVLLSLIRNRFKDQSGIIYCATRADTEQMAKYLAEEGLSCEAYHAKRDPKDRERIQSLWEKGTLKIVCATLAFGLGIDGAAVRFVIHLTLPKSLDTYAQEVGRAGRDGKKAHCILLYRTSDVNLVRGRRHKDGPSGYTEASERMFEAMVEYCENRSECRRVKLLEYFGEKFDAVNCNKGCDICSPRESKRKSQIRDVTQLAIKAVNLVKESRRSGFMKRVTILQAANILQGSRGKDLREKELDKTTYYGAAFKFKLTLEEVRSMLHHLESNHKVLSLETHHSSHSSRAPVQYLTLGPRAEDLLAGNISVYIDVHRGGPGSSAAKTKTKKPVSHTTAARDERRLQRDRFGKFLPVSGMHDAGGSDADDDRGATYFASDADDSDDASRTQPLRAAHFGRKRKSLREPLMEKSIHSEDTEDVMPDDEDVVPQPYKNYHPVTASATLNVRPYIPPQASNA